MNLDTWWVDSMGFYKLLPLGLFPLGLIHIALPHVCYFDLFCLGCIGQWPIGSGHSHAHVWQGDIETAVSELHPFLVTAW